ncbi:MAG: SCO family protein [Alphaproteobacteria bacterium]
MKRLFFYAIFAVVVLITALTLRARFNEHTPTVVTPQIGGAFSLTDHTGKAVTDADFRGRYTLVFFGYTYCPDVCPTAMQTISDALDLLGDKAVDVTPVFVSVDSKRDTPEVLKSFLENFHPQIVGLTGSPDQVVVAAKAYGVYYAIVKSDGGGADDYLMNHSSITYLMGPDGGFVDHFSHGTSADDMAAKLRGII